MARHRKNTVDYFPHVCTHGKTMFIVEQNYGNDGYAFWFKLLESLGAAEGHCIDLRNPDEWEFLLAKTRQNKDFCDGILALLAKLGAIDGELWHEHRCVWCQKFVDGVSDVYRKRKIAPPQKPILGTRNGAEEAFLDQKPEDSEVSDSGNRQSKVKESKVEKSIDMPPADITDNEREILAVIKSIPGWKFDYSKELVYLREMAIEFPTVDLLAEIKRLRAWLVDNPLKNNSKPHSRFRNWLEHAVEYSRKRQQSEHRVVAVYR